MEPTSHSFPANARIGLADPILQKPFAVKDSYLEIADRPGVGIEWDEDAVAHYRYEL